MRSENKLGFARKNFASPVSRIQFHSIVEFNSTHWESKKIGGIQ